MKKVLVVILGLCSMAYAENPIESLVGQNVIDALSTTSTCKCGPSKCPSGETISCTATNNQGGNPVCTCGKFSMICVDMEKPISHSTQVFCKGKILTPSPAPFTTAQ